MRDKNRPHHSGNADNVRRRVIAASAIVVVLCVAVAIVTGSWGGRAVHVESRAAGERVSSERVSSARDPSVARTASNETGRVARDSAGATTTAVVIDAALDKEVNEEINGAIDYDAIEPAWPRPSLAPRTSIAERKFAMREIHRGAERGELLRAASGVANAALITFRRVRIGCDAANCEAVTSQR